MVEKVKIDLTMYGIAEVLKWCHDRNNGRVPGVDTEGFKKMQALLAEKPQAGDYFTLDQFWKNDAKRLANERQLGGRQAVEQPAVDPQQVEVEVGDQHPQRQRVNQGLGNHPPAPEPSTAT